MNLPLLYHWQAMVSKYLSSFTVWQRKRLALFSLGVMLCEHCHQSRIGKVLAGEVMADCIVRRLRRCISDQNWTPVQFSLDWTRWVVTFLPKKPLVLLVDETSIGGRFRAMMVGAAYKRRCIQLAWTCYKAKSGEDYPIEGQVRMIAAMLAQGLALALGSQAVITGKARRLIKTKDDKLRRPLKACPLIQIHFGFVEIFLCKAKESRWFSTRTTNLTPIPLNLAPLP